MKKKKTKEGKKEGYIVVPTSKGEIEIRLIDVVYYGESGNTTVFTIDTGKKDSKGDTETKDIISLEEFSVYLPLEEKYDFFFQINDEMVINGYYLRSSNIDGEITEGPPERFRNKPKE